MAKKEKQSVSLPKAWKSVKHRNEMAQGKANYEGIWKLITGIIIALGLAYILLGGINQRSGGGVIVNDDGIYIDPSGKSGITLSPGQDGNTSNNQTEQSEEKADNEQNNSSPETP